MDHSYDDVDSPRSYTAARVAGESPFSTLASSFHRQLRDFGHRSVSGGSQLA